MHGALKDHEDYTGDEEMQETSSRFDSLDNLSSVGSSYSLDDNSSLGFSAEDDDDDEAILPSFKSGGRSEDKRMKDEDEYESARKARQERLRQLQEEEHELEASRKARQDRLRQLQDEENELEASRKARQDRLQQFEDETVVTRKARQKQLDVVDKSKTLDDDDHHKVSRKKLLKDDEEKDVSESPSCRKKSYDEEDDEDENLVEFLLKQRERMRNLDKDSDEDGGNADDTALSVASPISNGVHSSQKSERSPRNSVGDGESQITSRYRRKRQRRRTIEQLTSPEHNSNGVDL